MTFTSFERSIDRIAPAFLLFIGLIAAVGSFGLGV